MKTFVYKLVDLDLKDRNVLLDIQKKWSISYRKLYNNLELSVDKEYLKSLNVSSARLLEALVKEVLTLNERINGNMGLKEKLKKKVAEIEIRIASKTTKDKKLENIYKQKSLNQLKITNIELNNNKEYERLVELKRSYERKIIFGGYDNLIKYQKGLITKEEWQEARLIPVSFYGETSRKGNRFFDFKDLANGNIIFKLEATKIKINLKIKESGRKRRLELLALQEACKNKEISLTVKLTHDKIYLTYDESVLNNSKFDYKKLSKEIPIEHKKDKEYTKLFWCNKHKEHENSLKEGKLERYLTIDSNPSQIGFVITEKDETILERGSFEIEGKVSAQKRRYEYAHIIKRLFTLVEHYKVSYFGIEDLNIKDKNYGNTTSNRKIKNEWCKKLIEQLVTRRCNETKTILVKINPIYSSFIGNLTHKNLYDPIASATELNRRAIGQYEKRFKLLPEIPENIIKDVRQDLSDDSNGVHSWKSLFGSNLYKSYRCKTKVLLGELYRTNSHVCLYV